MFHHGLMSLEVLSSGCHSLHGVTLCASCPEVPTSRGEHPILAVELGFGRDEWPRKSRLDSRPFVEVTTECRPILIGCVCFFILIQKPAHPCVSAPKAERTEDLRRRKCMAPPWEPSKYQPPSVVSSHSIKSRLCVCVFFCVCVLAKGKTPFFGWFVGPQVVCKNG